MLDFVSGDLEKDLAAGSGNIETSKLAPRTKCFCYIFIVKLLLRAHYLTVSNNELTLTKTCCHSFIHANHRMYFNNPPTTFSDVHYIIIKTQSNLVLGANPKTLVDPLASESFEVKNLILLPLDQHSFLD